MIGRDFYAHLMSERAQRCPDIIGLTYMMHEQERF